MKIKKEGPEYTDREKVFAKGALIGMVARFKDGTWRCSSHPETETFPSKAEAIKWLIKRSNTFWANAER